MRQRVEALLVVGEPGPGEERNRRDDEGRGEESRVPPRVGAALAVARHPDDRDDAEGDEIPEGRRDLHQQGERHHEGQPRQTPVDSRLLEQVGALGEERYGEKQRRRLDEEGARPEEVLGRGEEDGEREARGGGRDPRPGEEAVEGERREHEEPELTDRPTSSNVRRETFDRSATIHW